MQKCLLNHPATIRLPLVANSLLWGTARFLVILSSFAPLSSGSGGASTWFGEGRNLRVLCPLVHWFPWKDSLLQGHPRWTILVSVPIWAFPLPGPLAVRAISWLPCTLRSSSQASLPEHPSTAAQSRRCPMGTEIAALRTRPQEPGILQLSWGFHPACWVLPPRGQPRTRAVGPLSGDALPESK